MISSVRTAGSACIRVRLQPAPLPAARVACRLLRSSRSSSSASSYCSVASESWGVPSGSLWHPGQHYRLRPSLRRRPWSRRCRRSNLWRLSRFRRRRKTGCRVTKRHHGSRTPKIPRRHPEFESQVPRQSVRNHPDTRNCISPSPIAAAGGSRFGTDDDQPIENFLARVQKFHWLHIKVQTTPSDQRESCQDCCDEPSRGAATGRRHASRLDYARGMFPKDDWHYSLRHPCGPGPSVPACATRLPCRSESVNLLDEQNLMFESASKVKMRFGGNERWTYDEPQEGGSSGKKNDAGGPGPCPPASKESRSNVQTND